MYNLFKKLLIEELEKRKSHTVILSEPNVILFGKVTIVIGDLGSAQDRESVITEVDKLLEKVLECRKRYYAAQASDMYIMMVAPLDYGLSKWRAISAEVERDDRLARKHIWLPNQDCIEGSFKQFIQTTFLATPGHSETGSSDALSLLSGDIGLPSGWEAILLNPELSGAELVSALMAVEELESE